MDAAPDPHDLLDSALAACTVLTLELYARRKGDWVNSRFSCTVERVSEKREEDGQVHYRLRREVSADGPLTDDQKNKLVEIANKCPIHRLMAGKIEVDTAISEAD